MVIPCHYFPSLHSYLLINLLTYLHRHGVKQPGNPWSDGPEYITQCPIEPGSNFTYQVIFSDEEGTLWWHAHSDWTRATVHGAIVILPEQHKTFPFPKPDGEEIVILGKKETKLKRIWMGRNSTLTFLFMGKILFFFLMLLESKS